jgi:hypothetical protein
MKKPPEGTKIPWRLHFQTLTVACFHSQIWKVRVALTVDRKTDLPEIQKSIDVCRRDV